MADLDLLARTALAAFRDGFINQLTTDTPGGLPRSLEPHVVGYKAGARKPFGANLIEGAHVTGKFTTVDLVHGNRARFWITVGLTSRGTPAVQASLTGFGTMEGFWPDQEAPDGDIAAAAARLGSAVAVYVLRDRFDPHYGW